MMGGLAWGPVETPTEGKFWWREGPVHEQVVSNWTPGDRGLSTIAMQKPAQHHWALPALHTGSFLGLCSHTKVLSPFPWMFGKGGGEKMSLLPKILGPLLTGRLRSPKLQGQALYWAWSLVNSQLEQVPGEREVRWYWLRVTVTGSLRLITKWPNTNHTYFSVCTALWSKAGSGPPVAGKSMFSWLHGYYFWAPE